MRAKPKRLTDADITLREWTRAKLAFYDALTIDADLTDLDCRVAWRLIHYHNLDRGYSWPSITRLAEEVHAARRSVIRSIDRLVAAGWFLKARGGGRGRSSRYAPRLGKVTERTPNVSKTVTEGALFKAETVTEEAPIIGERVTLESVNSDSNDTKTVTQGALDSFNESFKKTLGRDAAPAALEGRRHAAPQDKTWWELKTCAQIEFGAKYDHVADQLREAWDNSVGKQYAAGSDDDRDQLRLRVFAALRGSADIEDDKAKGGGEEAADDQRAVGAGK